MKTPKIRTCINKETSCVICEEYWYLVRKISQLERKIEYFKAREKDFETAPCDPNKLEKK